MTRTYLLIKAEQCFGMAHTETVGAFYDHAEAVRLRDEFNNQVEESSRDGHVYLYIDILPEIDEHVGKKFVYTASQRATINLKTGNINFNKIDRGWCPELMTRAEAKACRFKLVNEVIALNDNIASLEIETNNPKTIQNKLKVMITKLRNRINMGQEMLK